MTTHEDVNPLHLDLEGLIRRLESDDPTKVLRVGFHSPHSYRGYYHDLAFELAEDITVGEMCAAAKEALGSTYQGWKGGDYTMKDYTATWLVRRAGETGESIGAMFLELLLANTVARPFQVGDEVRWEWTGPGFGDGWFKARLVEHAPSDYPTGWAGEITDQGTLYGPDNWDLLVGDRVCVDEASLTLITTAEVSE